ncbi:MAG TPA: hypothetical protein PK331_15250 [Gordonia sp. (in: high G+C Gram-positive bacteria)]|jgi:hypothetical protein|uniref:hypothetical protein n=1 Tax=unclassified Gordonia (in: high G+C Gram-positive bacteria) TaxID=2657482 RepID=UPI0025C29981|nr:MULTISPECIES: hypothetical protein [unclassified Gordonia (in: high G+C Gram-positive bacteria)]HNP57305.1 hypothetical protein [Gordonia sp. (in: high G+C Gram-positive bacteria)]HRC52267.1 hypothetical protein [Gordonia sp. (in: high G+C Gram-positive bacteria)]
MSRIEPTITVVDDDAQTVPIDCCSPATVQDTQDRSTGAKESAGNCSCACC